MGPIGLPKWIDDEKYIILLNFRGSQRKISICFVVTDNIINDKAVVAMLSLSQYFAGFLLVKPEELYPSR